jgi:hypothetical protein
MGDGFFAPLRRLTVQNQIRAFLRGTGGTAWAIRRRIEERASGYARVMMIAR